MVTRRALGLSFAALGLTAVPALARRNAIAVPITVGDRVLMDVRLNGEGPFQFAVDTGAVVSGVRRAIADRLGLRKVRDVRLNGVSFPLYSLGEIVFGGAVRQENAVLFGLEGERLGADGLLAAGLLTTYDSELDFERGEWRVHPQGGPDRTGFERLASELRTVGPGSDRPFAEVNLDGEVLRPVWDTGAPRPMSLSYGTGRQLGLWRDDRPFGSVLVTGIQGASSRPGRIVRAGRLTIGASTYDRPLILIRPEGHPLGENILGLPIMRTLDLSLDRSERAVWVRRNGLQAGTEVRYGNAGTWLEEAGGGVRVALVSPQSPAADAGLLPGDMVQGPDGLRGAIDRLAGPSGAEREMTVRRGNRTLTIRFILADYL
jgi:serine protease Do